MSKKDIDITSIILLIVGIMLNIIVYIIIRPLSEFTVFFIAIMIMYLLYKYLVNYFSGKNSFDVLGHELIYTAILIISFNFSSELFFLLSNEEKIDLVAFLLFVVLSVNFLAPLSTKSDSYFNEKLIHAGSAELKLPDEPIEELSQSDRQRIAAHEIGHLIACVGYGQLPLDFYVLIGHNKKSPNSLGHIKNLCSVNRITSKSYLEIQMLIYLSGGQGTEFYLGEKFNGNNDDMRKWNICATNYLENGYGDSIYISEPKSVIEIEANNNLKQKLKLKQIALIEQLFELNKNTYHEMVTQLLEKELLLHSDIVPLMQKIKIPENYPMPLGEFSVFSDKWEKESEYILLP